MSCEHAFDDGAYVLGALSPAERARFEQHLDRCRQCRDAVADLAVLPGLLGRLSPDVATGTATGGAPDAQRLPRLVSAVRASRSRARRRTTGLVLVAACAALLAGLAAGSLRRPGPPQQAPAMTAMRPVAATTVTADIALREVPEGTAVRMRCSYPPSDRYTKAYVFRLVVLAPGGVLEQIGSWNAGPGDEIVVTGTVRLGLGEIIRVELRSRDGTPLLVYDVPA